MQYLKDVALPRALDEQTTGTLTAMVYFNQVELMNHILGDPKIFAEL